MIEKIAYKATEKVIGSNRARKLANSYNRSPITDTTIIADLYRGNDTGLPRPNCPHYEAALEHITLLSKPKKPLKTVHFTGTRNYDWNNTGSAELPYVKDKRFIRYVNLRFDRKETTNASLTKGNGMNYILEKERIKVHQIKDQTFSNQEMLYDTRMHARSYVHELTKDPKVRAVYGVCCTLLFIEIMLLWPLMDHMKHNSFIAWGYETFNGGLERLRQQVISYSYHFSLDFSIFDKLLPFWLLLDIHKIWQSFSELGPYYEDDPRYPNPSTDPNRIRNLWNFMTESIFNMVYRAPDGSRYRRRHSGLPSGLMQTQLIGSFANAIMVLSALHYLGIPFSDVSFKTLGDDGTFSITYIHRLSLDHLETISQYVKRTFNAIINVDKSVFLTGSSMLQFLSYRFYNGAVRRVNDDLIIKLLYPEKAHFSVETTKSRALGILVANLGFDPEVHAICLDILQYLNSVEYKTTGLDWYDRARIEAILTKMKQTPSRHELYALARTVNLCTEQSNFQKYIH